MKIISYAIIIILISTSLGWSQNGNKPKSIIGLDSSSRINNEYMVVFKDNVVDQLAFTLTQTTDIKMKQAIEIVVNDFCTEFAQTAQGSIILTYTNALYGFALSSNSEQAVTNIVNDSRIEYIEVNQTASASTTQLNPTWGLDRIDQQNLPLDNSYTYSHNGSGVTVYVVDSGVFVNSVEFGGRASWGVNFINDGNGQNDCTDHGTHVAGTIASTTYGVAKNAKIKAIRILDCANNTSSSLIVAGIDWVINHHVGVAPAVLNLSIESPKDLSINNAVNSAVTAGITVVSAAGNGNEDACNISPASATGSITVGATTINDTRSTFGGSRASNFGPCIALFAPGSAIVSLSQTGSTNTSSGTSFAAPHVAGAAALYLQENPQATPTQTKQAIITNASNITIGNAGTGSPNRIINIDRLLITPDAYEEDDDNFSDNNVIGINNAFQQHTFSDDSVDWIKLVDQPLSSELNLTDGYCDNLSCGLELANISNVDLCLQFAKLGTQTNIICGLIDGFYTDINLVNDNLSNSQCDARYNLGWTHVRLIDNQTSPSASKKYDAKFSCTYDEHVELPAPDSYEDDDVADFFNYTLPLNGSVTQDRNFVDDSYDWLTLPTEKVLCGNSCTFNFTHIGNANDLCLEIETRDEHNIIPQFCNIQENTDYEIFREGTSLAVLIHNLGNSGHNTEYTVGISCQCNGL